MVDPRRLRVLQAVAAAGSVAAAAERLHLTPPAVSQQLRALERETAARLLDRSGRRVALTAAGRLLAAHAERIAAQLVEAERELAELTGRVAGPVRIAAFQSVMDAVICPALRRLAESHPGVRPTILEQYGAAAVGALRRGGLDIALTEYDAAGEPPREPDLRLRPLLLDPYRVVIPREWPITVRSVADLAAHPWVAGPPGTACDHALRRLATAAGITPRITDVCVEFPSVLALVASGRGAAVVPRLTLAAAHHQVDVCRIEDLGGRWIATLDAAHGRAPSPATRAVLDALVEVAAA